MSLTRSVKNVYHVSVNDPREALAWTYTAVDFEVWVK